MKMVKATGAVRDKIRDRAILKDKDGVRGRGRGSRARVNPILCKLRSDSPAWANRAATAGRGAVDKASKARADREWVAKECLVVVREANVSIVQ
jgi:hypothetical protein